MKGKNNLNKFCFTTCKFNLFYYLCIVVTVTALLPPRTMQTSASSFCFCTMCGEELTKPHFFNGKPYGWSCITKVNPNAKKSKDIYKVFQVTETRISENGVLEIKAIDFSNSFFSIWQWDANLYKNTAMEYNTDTNQVFVNFGNSSFNKNTKSKTNWKWNEKVLQRHGLIKSNQQ